MVKWCHNNYILYLSAQNQINIYMMICLGH
jgi:hypothetical protein